MCTVSITFNDLTSYQAGLLIRMHCVLKKIPAPGRAREEKQEELDDMCLERLKEELEAACAEFIHHHFPHGGGNDPPG